MRFLVSSPNGTTHLCYIIHSYKTTAFEFDTNGRMVVLSLNSKWRPGHSCGQGLYRRFLRPLAMLLSFSSVSKVFSINRDLNDKWVDAFFFKSKILYFICTISNQLSSSWIVAIFFMRTWFPHYWAFMMGINSPVNPFSKGHWCKGLVFSLLSVWTKCWTKRRVVRLCQCDTKSLGSPFSIIEPL